MIEIDFYISQQQHQHQHQQQQQHQHQQSSQSSAQDEDETVDVESYGDETSNGAINMTSNVIHHTNSSQHNNNNNNNNPPMKPDPPMTKIPPMEESAITSLSSIVPHWDRKNRLNLPLNCKSPIQPASVETSFK